MIIDSHNFDEIIENILSRDRDSIVRSIIRSARNLESAGANFILICTNTIHKFANEIEDSILIPLINIIDVTAQSIKAHGSRIFYLRGAVPGLFTYREMYLGVLPFIVCQFIVLALVLLYPALATALPENSDCIEPYPAGEAATYDPASQLP